MTRLADLMTPALIVDERRMTANIDRMRAKVASLGIGFRPHIKTAKSAEIALLLTGGAPGPITVSTLAEARAAAEAGFRDILYAAALTPNKIDTVLAMRGDGVDLTVIVDSVAAAEMIAAASRAHGTSIPTLIEIDSDGARAGIRPDDEITILAIAAALAEGAEMAGVMTHCGASYRSRSEADALAWAERERDAAVAAADLLRTAGHGPRIVSVGSTPTVLAAQDMTGITEARAGVFLFHDLVIAGTAACTVDDIALSVLASVSGIQADRGRYLVDAGWMALSRDRGTSAQAVDHGYGLVCDAGGRPYGDLIVTEANQEHGVLALRPGSDGPLPELAIGDLVRILPNHACATAAPHDLYHRVTGASDDVTGTWRRFGGW